MPERSLSSNIYQLFDYTINFQALIFSKWYSLFIFVYITALKTVVLKLFKCFGEKTEGGQYLQMYNQQLYEI